MFALKHKELGWLTSICQSKSGWSYHYSKNKKDALRLDNRKRARRLVRRLSRNVLYPDLLIIDISFDNK